MHRKVLIVFAAVAILSMLISGTALAYKGKLPTWKTAFDPGTDMPGQYFIHSVEEYKGDLYVVAAGMWAGGPDSAGRLFRSPNGKNWTPATGLGFDLGAKIDSTCSPDPNYYDSSWDMIVFKGKLYLLPDDDSCWGELPGVIMRSNDGKAWESVVTAEDLGKFWSDDSGVTYYGQFYKLAVFNGMIYVDLSYFDTAAQYTTGVIFRSPNGDPGTWQEVRDFPGWATPGSFQTFKGALYVASDGVFMPDWTPLPEQIWRSYDGLNWEMVVNGFPDSHATNDGLGGFAEYQGYLYVGVGSDAVEGNGGQIWRSKDGLHWTAVILDGFGNPNNTKIDGLVVYDGQLYAYTVNLTDGCSVYRTRDAKSWEPVNQPGWGNPQFTTSHLTSDQVVFKGNLYMGVLGVDGVLLKMDK